jgi:K+-sensing histidine kinase KdpD
MVCVTRQYSCERLIHKGAELAAQEHCMLLVVHVAPPGDTLLDGREEGKALDFLFTCAKNEGAELTVLRSDDVYETIIKFANKNNAAILVLGEARTTDNKKENDVAWRLKLALPEVQVHSIAAYE